MQLSTRKISNANEKAQPVRVKIIGQVFDTKEKKIAGAKVICNEEATNTLFDGTFEFSVLAPFTYTITVTQKGFEKQSRKIELTTDEFTPLKFYLNPKKGYGTIYGRVYDSESKTPLSSGGTVIMVLPTENRYVVINPENGEYKFLDLPPGKYNIYTSILEYEDVTQEIILKKNENKRVDFFCSLKTAEPPWG